MVVLDRESRLLAHAFAAWLRMVRNDPVSTYTGPYLDRGEAHPDFWKPFSTEMAMLQDLEARGLIKGGRRSVQVTPQGLAHLIRSDAWERLESEFSQEELFKAVLELIASIDG